MTPAVDQRSDSPAKVLNRQDVEAYIENIGDDCFILLPIKPDSPAPSLLVELINQVVTLYAEVSEAREATKLKDLVELLTPDIQTSESLVRQARMMAVARQKVLKSARWLNAEQISVLAGFSSNNPSAQPNKWKSKKVIFAIHSKGIDYFPEYALNPNENYRPVKVLADILSIFDGSKDSWGLAYWFAGANGFLGGGRPQDLLHSDPNRVLAAAKDEMTGITHG